ncbi:MAG: DnaJ domain-containing protein [Pseudomonadales bacterium]|nr:DnaJ domain-containing protein [Pseudomonadales bacterium]
MTRNRRNYYRILHVQPEAPDAVIRASYRTLMGPLGQHPDRGGDHAGAALLNEAYAVLGDPERRRAYDRLLRKERMRASRRADPAGAVAGGAGRASTSAPPTPAAGCPFCARRVDAGTAECAQCASPLTVPPAPDARRRELFGKRAMARFTRERTVALTPAWGDRPVAVTMRDLSLMGTLLVAGTRVPVDQVVRVAGQGLEALAQVVSARRVGEGWSLHCRFLTLRIAGRPGQFVSKTA